MPVASVFRVLWTYMSGCTSARLRKVIFVIVIAVRTLTSRRSFYALHTKKSPHLSASLATATVQSNRILPSTTLCAQIKEILLYFVCNIFQISNFDLMPSSAVDFFYILCTVFVMLSAGYLMTAVCVRYFFAFTKQLFVSFQRLIKY